MKNLTSKIKMIASKNPNGFTIDLDLKPINQNAGYLVAIPETQDCFDNEGLEKVVRIAIERNCYIGGWFNPENRKYYYDATFWVQDLNEAIKVAKANKQIAIFDLKNLRSIRVR